MALSLSELRSWYRIIGGVRALLAALDRRLRDESGISHDDYVVLAGLYRAPGQTLGMTELAEDAVVSPSRLSNMVSRFEEQGLVSRRAAEHDRRCVEAALTSEGMHRVEEITDLHLGHVQELVFGTLGNTTAREMADALDRIRKATLSTT